MLSFDRFTHTQTLEAQPGFFSKLVPVVVRQLGGAYPELVGKADFVTAVIADEEQVNESCVGCGIVDCCDHVLPLRLDLFYYDSL